MTTGQKTCDAGNAEAAANADSKDSCTADMRSLKKDIGALAGDVRAVTADKIRQAAGSAKACLNEALHSAAGAVEDAAARIKGKTAADN